MFLLKRKLEYSRRLEFETDFDTIYPGTNKTCAYVLRYFFHTDIHFNKNLNELISMEEHLL